MTRSPSTAAVPNDSNGTPQQPAEGARPVTSIREAFAARFGEGQAALIEAAAEKHANGVNSENRGTDPFKWVLLIAIGYQCIEIERYRKYHGITAPWDEVKAWMIENADLASHNGDADYLAAFCGAYNEYMGIAPSGEQASA